MVVCWPIYAAGSVLVAVRPRVVTFLFPFFRAKRVRRALAGAVSVNSALPLFTLPLYVDPWTLVQLGQAIQRFRSSSEFYPEERRTAQQLIASLLVRRNQTGSSNDVCMHPDLVTDNLVTQLEESVMRRSVPGVTQVSVLARILSGVGWFGAMATLAPAIASVRVLLRPLLRPIGRFLPPSSRWFAMYYCALALTAAPRLPDVQLSRARCIFYSVSGCGMAWGLMVLEETARARLLRFARQAERWERARWASNLNPFQSQESRSSNAMIEALEWQRQVQGQDRQRAFEDGDGTEPVASEQRLGQADGSFGPVDATVEGGVGTGFETQDLDAEERHVSLRERKVRQLAKYGWMAVTSGIPALTMFSRTLGLFSSGAVFVGLCSAEAWFLTGFRERGDQRNRARDRRPRLAYPSAPAVMWIAKHGIRFIVPRCGARLAAFDVGVSVFGPLTLNVIALCRSPGQWRGKAFCLLELVGGVALGNDELLFVGSTFAVPFAIADIVSVADRVPLLVFAASSSVIYVGSSLLGANNEENRVFIARVLQKVLLVS